MEFQLTQQQLDKIDQYIKGNLEGDQLIAFEEELAKNEALMEEMLIQKQLYKAFEKNDDSFTIESDMDKLQDKLQNPEYQSLSQKIRSIGNEFIQEQGIEKKSLWIRFRKIVPAAAAILILVVISAIYLFNDRQSLDQYYTDHINWNTELPSFSEKGDSKIDFVKAEEFFRAEKFVQAIESFESIDPTNELYPYSLMYIGASHANLDQDQEALKAFNDLAELTEFAESTKGLWYAALLHLKLKDRTKALETLEKITTDPNNYRYADALKIIKDLE